MSYPINYPTPQGANIQIFNSTGGTAGAAGGAGAKTISTWVKPQGASFVWFTLIGAGGGGDPTTPAGGGSGAVVNFMCPAFLIPDSLQVWVGKGGDAYNGLAGADTIIAYQQKNSTGYALLTATHGTNSGGGGSAMTANAFTAMGFFQSISGQAGIASSITTSTSTFLAGGSQGAVMNGQYGYSIPDASDGLFQMQPIIVGLGGNGASSDNLKAGVGCGGAYGASRGGLGGNGMAVIITW